MIYILVIILYLYFLWRNLRDDYESDKLITFGWQSILLFLIGSRIAYGLVNWGIFETVSQWWQINSEKGMIFGGGVGLVLVLSWWTSSKNNWKLWSFLEDFLPLMYVVLFVLVLLGWWVSKDIKSLMISLTMLFGFTLTLMFDGRYRSYPWYYSGKKGFNVGATGVIISIVLIIEAIVIKEKIGLLIIYAVLGLLSLTQLVILGEIWHKKK